MGERAETALFKKVVMRVITSSSVEVLSIYGYRRVLSFPVFGRVREQNRYNSTQALYPDVSRRTISYPPTSLSRRETG